MMLDIHPAGKRLKIRKDSALEVQTNEMLALMGENERELGKVEEIGSEVSLDLEEGDIVLFKSGAGFEINDQIVESFDESYQIIPQSGVLATAEVPATFDLLEEGF